ncbi:MAG: GGDEF domain-containing protein [Gammaproteobacteria bacterium]|nr:GGDEF domain-containing protein [Gammaproteobacteria bacterium]
MQETSHETAREIPWSTLSQLRLFDRVDIDVVHHLLEECTLRELRPNETLIERDQENASLFLILEGVLRIHLDPNGPAIAKPAAGEAVGELSVLDKRKASATVIADCECLLLELDETLVWLMVHASHDFGRNLLILLSERIRSVNGVVDKSMQLQREYQVYATVDPLTGLYNRRWLNDALALEMTRCLSREQPFSVLMLDIDRFKKYNDRHGHLAGDTVLQAVAAAVRGTIRDQDMAVRFGGEEMLVLLPNADCEQATRVAERMADNVRHNPVRRQADETLPGVTASIGVTSMRGRETSRQLLERVDQALYRAKSSGRDRVVVD